MTNNKEMKDVFISGNKGSMLYMLDYIKKTLDISEADYWNYIGHYVIYVPKDKYESVLRDGKKYAVTENIPICWLNHYNEKREFINSCDIGYGILPKTLIPGQEKKQYSKRRLWGCFDDCTPKTILEYFDSMKDYLKVDNIAREYNGCDDALTISPVDLDYEVKSQLFKEFVDKFGYGPFQEILPLTFTGEVVKEPILVKKKELK